MAFRPFNASAAKFPLAFQSIDRNVDGSVACSSTSPVSSSRLHISPSSGHFLKTHSPITDQEDEAPWCLAKRRRTDDSDTSRIIRHIDTAKYEILSALTDRQSPVNYSSVTKIESDETIAIGGSPMFQVPAKKLLQIEKISGCPITFARKLLEHFHQDEANDIRRLDPTTANKVHRQLTSDERLMVAVASETMGRFQLQSMALFQSALRTAVEKRLYAETMYRRKKSTGVKTGKKEGKQAAVKNNQSLVKREPSVNLYWQSLSEQE